jgi:hypothetical protein
MFGGPCLCAQGLSGLDGATRIGPGVAPPRLLHRVEPEYSPIARADHVQGTVVLELAVDEQSRPTGIHVISLWVSGWRNVRNRRLIRGGLRRA